MTTAKLLSAVEPVIRYHRARFRGGHASSPGSPKFELGLQQKEDAQQRLVDVWAVGEAGASLGFAAARLADDFDPIERAKNALFEERGITGPAQAVRGRQKGQGPDPGIRPPHVPARVRAPTRPGSSSWTPTPWSSSRPWTPWATSSSRPSSSGTPATGATYMREAISLMGGYGITEDCPGFFMNKWADAQLEATYEGPEAVQRMHMTVTMTDEVFLAHVEQWIAGLKAVAAERPGKGACVLAAAYGLWLWTLDWLQKANDVQGKPLYHRKRQGVTFAMADALCWLLAAHHLILDTVELEDKGPMNPTVAEALDGLGPFYSDLACHQAARASGEAARILTELVFGYQAHPGCGENGCSPDGPPSCDMEDIDVFLRIKAKVEGCMAGSRLARERAGIALTQVMIPEALDYPL